MEKQDRELLIRIDERVEHIKDNTAEMRVELDTKVDKVVYEEDKKTLSWKIRAMIIIGGLGGGGSALYKLWS